MTAAPLDPGLQAERTLLSWRRTCLSLAIASAVAVRFTTALDELAAVQLGAAALVLSSTGWVIATRRYLRAHRSLTADPTMLGLGGTTVAITAAATVLLAVAALTVILVGTPFTSR